MEPGQGPTKGDATGRQPPLPRTSRLAELSSLRREYDAAFQEYRLRRYPEAETRLRRLITATRRWTQVISLPSQPTGPDVLLVRSHFYLLEACANTLLGRVQHQLGDWEAARSNFDSAIALFEQWLGYAKEGTGQYYKAYGIALQHQQKHERAIEALKKAVETGGDFETHRYLGKTLLEGGRFAEAEVHLRTAIELAPSDHVSYELLGKNLEALGRTEEAATLYLNGAVQTADKPAKALALLERALRLDPDNIAALTAKADILHATGSTDQALDAADKVLEREPHFVVALATKGAELHTLGEHDKALEVLNEALRLNPSYPTALSAKGSVLHALGRHQEALETLEEALKLNPDDPVALGAKGRVLGALGDNADAIDLLQRAVKTGPPAVSNFLGLFEVLEAEGRYEEALDAIDRARNLAPDDIELARRQAFALLYLQRNAEATRTLQEALEGHDTNTLLLGDLLFAQLQADDYDAAQATLQRAPEQGADDGWLLSIKGVFFIQIGRYDDAIETLDKAIQHRAPVGWAYAVRSWAHRGLALGYLVDGRRKQAAEHAGASLRDARKAVQQNSEELTWQLAVGEALHLLGRQDEARDAYSLVSEEGQKRVARRASAEDLNLRGWAHYRLEEYPQAVRLFIRSLGLRTDMPQVQFNLALASICNQQHALGLREYRRGLVQAREKHVLSRRGLLRVALDELREAIQLDREKAAEQSSPPPVTKSLWRKAVPTPDMSLAGAEEAREAEQILREALQATLDAETQSG
jgi:tetratricopeptide (TPR) repeat protein